MTQSPKKKSSITSLLALSLPLLYLSFLNTSPSNLIKDTTFWFLLSNSIILIVAVDSGFFSATDDTNIYINKNHFIPHDTSYNLPPCFVEEQSNKSIENHANVKKMHLNCSEIDREGAKNESYPPMEKQPKTTPKSSSKNEAEEEEENEYWKMSDEELNRRVEEFIRRFNRELSSNSNR